MIISPECFGLRARNRTDAAPLLLQFLENLKLVGVIGGINQYAEPFDQLLLLAQIFTLLFFLLTEVLNAAVADEFQVRVKGVVQRVTLILKISCFSAVGSKFCKGRQPFLFTGLVVKGFNLPEYVIDLLEVVFLTQFFNQCDELSFRVVAVVHVFVVILVKRFVKRILPFG